MLESNEGFFKKKPPSKVTCSNPTFDILPRTHFDEIRHDGQFCFFWHYASDDTDNYVGEITLDNLSDMPLYVCDNPETWYSPSYSGRQMLLLFIAWVADPILLLRSERGYEDDLSRELIPERFIKEGFDSFFYYPVNEDGRHGRTRQGRLLKPKQQLRHVECVLDTHVHSKLLLPNDDIFSVTLTSEEVDSDFLGEGHKLLASEQDKGGVWHSIFRKDY